MHYLGTILFVLAAYLLGSVPSGYWVGRLVADIDIRTVGSKNIGATNVARALGRNWGLLVLVLDIAKGALPVFTALTIWPATTGRDMLSIVFISLAAFSGHLWSLFLRFRGGKGVATALGITLVLLPRAAFLSLAVFVLVAWRWRYVSLASITAALSLPISGMLTGYPLDYVALTAVFGVCILIRHRDNMRALCQGREPKL